ncbi:ferredoxin domain-containing protein [Desulfobacterium sp. N47]
MEAIDMVAQLMVISATTAPKSRGENYVCTKILKDKEIIKLAKKMTEFGTKKAKKDFDRDAKNISASDSVVLIGIKDAKPLGLDCGACGYPDCNSLSLQKKQGVDFMGPFCALRTLDMGIAIGSAVKTASMFNVDNRIMYRIGAVVRYMKLVDWDFIMGIPLSVSGKNIYFDR